MPPDAEAGRPLRVALVVERYTRGGSGVERVVRELADGLVRHGDEVHVIARDVDADAAAQPEAGTGARVHRVNASAAVRGLRLLEFSRGARQVVEREPFDVVHGFARVHAQDLFHSGVGCHAAYLRAVHGALARTARRFSLRHAVQLQLEAQIARDPRIAIQCVSEAVADDFRQHYDVPDDRLIHLPNGVDVARFAAPPEPSSSESLRAEHAAGADAVWLFLGSGFRRKGLGIAIEALARSSIERSVLWVIGHDRPLRWRLLARRLGVEARVRFLGERRDVDRWLAACDGLLLPTRYDPAPLVVLEAAAAGKPVVTSRACGHTAPFVDPDLVIADVENAESFAAALDRLADGRRRGRIARDARRAVEVRDWKRVVDETRAVYTRIAASRRARVSGR